MVRPNVLVTRPQKQARNMVHLCQEAGFTAISSPMIDIEVCPKTPEIDFAIAQLVKTDWVIFTSVNAVEHAMLFILKEYSHFPEDINVACVGLRSAARLRQFCKQAIVLPNDSFTSEGLLQLPELQTVVEKRVVIFTGESGRTIIAETLRAKQAQVAIAKVYRRKMINVVDVSLQAKLEQQKIDAILISSGEILQNFMSLYRESVTMNSANSAMVFIMASKRIAKIGKELGISEQSMIIAESAHDEKMLEVLISWKKGELK